MARILAFSDLHNDYSLLPALGKKAAGADIIICAGDVSVFEFGLVQTLAMLASWGKPIIMIHGNHEEEESLAEACSLFPTIRFAHKQDMDISGVRIIAWGGGGFSTTDNELEKWSSTLTPDDRPTIIVTHPPPYGTRLDRLHGRPVGNKTVREVIERFKPAYALSGHIHENIGTKDTIGTSICINLGPKGTIITL